MPQGNTIPPGTRSGSAISLRHLNFLPFMLLCLALLFAAWIPCKYLVLPHHGLIKYLSDSIRIFPSILILSVIILWVLQDNISLTIRGFFVYPHSRPILCFLLVGLMGVLGAPNSLPVFLRTGYYFLSGGLVYYLFLRFCQSETQFRLFYIVILCSAAGVGLYGIGEFLTGQNFLFGKTFTPLNPLYYQFALSGYSRRITSTVGHPVFVGTYLMMCLPLGLHALTYATHWKRRTLALLAFTPILLGLLLTFTRGAWVGAVVGSLFYLKKRPGAYRVVFVVGMLALFIGIMGGGNRFVDILKSRNPLQEIRGEDSLGFRLVAYRHAADTLAKNPLFGIGTGNYRYLPQSVGDSDDTPDNMYLRILVENGVLGLMILIGLFYLILKDVVTASRQGGIRGGLLRAFAASFIAFYVDILTCDALYFSLTRLTFWSFAGVAIALSDSSNPAVN